LFGSGAQFLGHTGLRSLWFPGSLLGEALGEIPLEEASHEGYHDERVPEEQEVTEIVLLEDEQVFERL